MPTNENQQQTDTDTDAVEEGTTESVGDILRAERLRKELTEKEVADHLHITMHYVRAIESNSFDKLPGAVFAKGYIKSYALLLGLEASQVIGSYDDYVSDQQDAAREKTRIQVRRRKDKNRPWVIGSGIAFVSLFLVLWFFNRGSEESVELDLEESPQVEDQSELEPLLVDEVTAAPASMPAPIATPDLTLLGSAALDTPTQDDVDQSQAGLLAQVDSDLIAEEIVAEVNDAIDQASSFSEQDDQQQSSQSAEILSTSETTISASLEANDESATTIELPGAEEPERSDGRILVETEGSDVLLISFIGESWVEVSDSFENLVYRDLTQAGNVLEITGTAPFDILLGDAPFAVMTLNGIDIDVSENIRIDNSARLTVGL